MSNTPATLTLEADIADFITHHVAMIVASASADRVPSLARVYGCSVSADRRVVHVMVLADHSVTLLDDLRATRRIAVVATNPSTHKTIQLKGVVDAIAPIQPVERLGIQTFMQTFGDDIKLLGFDNQFTRAFTPEFAAEVVRISFLPAAMFVSTPGPQAGAPLKSPT
jgi:hypothetical protein